MEQHTLIQLDIDAIVRGRLPRNKRKYLPRFATNLLAKIFHAKQLNEMLRYAYPRRGSGFSSALLEYLNNSIEVVGLEKFDKSGRYLFASNHPLGGLDGVAMIKVLGEYFGDENIKFLVNDMLMHVEPLSDVFLPINKFGAQGKAAAKLINATYASDTQMLIFPAGLVSRLHDDGKIYDLPWQKAFVAKAMEYDRTIVPVRFEALNSRMFYKLARWRKKLGIKINLEQALLPGELCKARNKRWRVVFGDPISPEELRKDSRHPALIAADIQRNFFKL